MKEKLMSRFFYQIELWRGKENFDQVYEMELKELSDYIDDNEREALR